ncbi:MAG: sugar kinase [Candidatus Tectomicrobia bacterium]|uniref:Sugar kinase n=1 Tax=Tectimicrobiota bacterium TaxID=2528274 RepID=A0A937VZK4_UNCTE|nr:sugar kinase [Candidatus Tectomicrobia bacterium]
MAQYDVVTLGETMLCLTPPGLRRLEQATTLEVEVAGTESNMAIGLARLGLKPLWLSRLTRNPLGRLIARTIAGQGVDTSRIVWTDDDRVGLLFLEEGKAPRGSQVFYDRRYSAISQMRPEELPTELFHPEGARLLHLTGITLALGAQSAATCQRAMELARAAGWLVSFDVNYRRTLWEPATARQHCEAYLRLADLLFIPRGDACTLYNLAPTLPPEDVMAALALRYPQAVIALTLGSEGALGRDAQGTLYRQTAFPAEEVGRIGGGDAFAAGFLYAYLTTSQADARLPQALAWGAAMAALKYSVPGDVPIIERWEVEALLAQGHGGPRLRR